MVSVVGVVIVSVVIVSVVSVSVVSVVKVGVGTRADVVAWHWDPSARHPPLVVLVSTASTSRVAMAVAVAVVAEVETEGLERETAAEVGVPGEVEATKPGKETGVATQAVVARVAVGVGVALAAAMVASAAPAVVGKPRGTRGTRRAVERGGVAEATSVVIVGATSRRWRLPLPHPRPRRSWINAAGLRRASACWVPSKRCEGMHPAAKTSRAFRSHTAPIR